MANVTILSCFRNAAGAQIARYFAQIDSLVCLLSKRGDTLQLVLGYGDSDDGTEADLYEEASHRMIETVLLGVDHGGPHFGSIEHPERFRQLAYVGNQLLSCVLRSADVVGIVESDLIWEAQVLIDLMAHLQFCEAIAPMVMDGPNSFYDVYAYRKDGVRFTKTPPFHRGVNGSVVKVDSAGSVLFMRGDLARLVRFPEEDVIVGLCRRIYELGGAIFLDPSLSVFHP